MRISRTLRSSANVEAVAQARKLAKALSRNRSTGFSTDIIDGVTRIQRILPR